MTDTPKKEDEQIDLNAEIENLEDLLSSNDESLVEAFPLDDFEELSATPRTSPKKSGMGKYVGYLAFLAILGGGGYGAYKYLPNLMQNTMLSEFEQNITNRGNAFDPQNIVPEVKTTIPVIEEITESEPLPVASDEVSEIIFEDYEATTESINEISNGFDEILPTIEVELNEEVVAAETIAEALAITKDATIEVPQDEVIVEEVLEDTISVEEVETAIQEEISNFNEATSFERIPALPITKNRMEEDLSPLQDKKIDTANDVMAMPKDELIAVVEAPIAEKIIVEEIIETVPTATPEIIEEVVAETVIEEPQIPTFPVEVVKPIEVIEKKVVAVKKITPKKKIVKRVVKPEDPRVKQAQAFYKSSNYASALNLYIAILVDDPTNTSALTGKQLTKAKLRMSGQSSMQQMPTTPSTPVVPVAPKTQPVLDNSIQGLQNQMVSNPRDASVALKLASAYKSAGNKIQAVEMYRKALQLDVIYKSGIDRMAVYDALADMQ